MAVPSIDNLTDDDLNDLLNAVLNLQEKRARLAATPKRLFDEAQRYLDDGGDPAALELPTEPSPPAPVEDEVTSAVETPQDL